MNFAYSLDNSDMGRDQRIGQASLSWTDALTASAENAWVHNPNVAMGDTTDLYLAEHPEWREPAAAVSGLVQATPGLSTVGGALFPGPINASQKALSTPPKADEFIDAHSLNQQYGQTLGLSFDQPMRRGAVDILVGQKKAQMQRDFVLAHAPTGIGFQATNLATSLAVSAADPLNVAAAFVPVVSEARYGLWAARYGATAARVATGAIEGGVGTAALQPIEIARDQAFQEHYGAADAFWNVTFGTALGGGLHAGFGVMSDLLGRLHPETREAALRAAVGQSADGRAVDVSAPIASDPAFAPDGSSPEIDTTLSRARENALSDNPTPATSPEASRVADEQIKSGAGDDIDEEHKLALAQVDHYEKQGILSPADAAQARAGSEDIQKAQQNGSAAKAAATCLTLHP